MNTRFFTILVGLFSTIAIVGQVQPKHDKKMYISSDGKLFFNKDLPVYFWVSTSPSADSSHYKLPSEGTPQYANPMYFDTEGRNTLRSPSAVDTVTKKVILPEIDVQFQMYADGQAPQTRLFTKMKNSLIIKERNYTSDTIHLYFHSNDDYSGVANIMVSVDSAPYIKYKDTIKLTNSKSYNVKYYAYDNTGNVEAVKSLDYVIDRCTPESELLVEGENYNNILAGNSTIKMQSRDTISGVKAIYYNIDSGAFKLFVNKITASTFGPGAHLLRYYAEDKVGNIELSKEYSFYVDVTAPQVIEEIIGKTFIANGREFSAGTSKLKLSAFDNKAGVKEIYYSINNAPFELYEKPLVLSNQKGNLIVRNYAVDNVGNKSISDISNSRKNKLSYVDLGAPWVGYSFSGPNIKTRDTIFISHKTLVTLSAKDDESGIQKIEYQIDSSELYLYKKEFSLNIEGLHQFTIFGYDNTDNLTRQAFEAVVDTTGPIIFERFSSLPQGALTIDSVSIPVYSSSVVLFLSATDERTGYDNLLFSLNGAAFQSYMRDIRNFAVGRTNTLKVLAIDKLGNKTERLIEFYIK